jgi:molybdopterin synthase catalytic subunit
MTVRIQTQDFDVSAELAALRAGNPQVGAVCAFVGTVREWSKQQRLEAPIDGMSLEHYPVMTESAIEAIIAQAKARFDMFDAVVIHRVGDLAPTDQIVLVAVTSMHRHESFQACEFVMDYLKTQAPFWKKEHSAGGSSWVDAREADDVALARWGIQANNAGI